MAGKKKTLKRSKKFAFIALICILIILVFLSIYKSVPLESKALDLHVTVDERLVFNLDKDKVYFGKVPPGSSSSRDIILKHSYDSAIIVKIEKYGEISNWIDVGATNRIISGGREEKISLTVSVPENASYGNYTGQIKISFYRS